MHATTAIRAYAKVDMESGVVAADPHKLISMLYQGALLAIANARNGMLRKDIGAKCEAVSKALLIIEEGLQASLDKNSGGELAQNLDSLYRYMCARLLAANLNNDAEALNEVSALLADLKQAWDTIRPGATARTPVRENSIPAAKPAALVYGRM